MIHEIKKLNIETTFSCNLGCSYCINREVLRRRPADVLPVLHTFLEKYSSIIDKDVFVVLRGGEVTSDLKKTSDIIRCLKSIRPNARVMLQTNGTLLHAEAVQSMLLGCGAPNLCVGFDSSVKSVDNLPPWTIRYLQGLTTYDKLEISYVVNGVLDIKNVGTNLRKLVGIFGIQPTLHYDVLNIRDLLDAGTRESLVEQLSFAGYVRKPRDKATLLSCGQVNLYVDGRFGYCTTSGCPSIPQDDVDRIIREDCPTCKYTKYCNSCPTAILNSGKSYCAFIKCQCGET